MTKEKPLPGSPEFLTAVRKALEYDSEAGVLRWADGEHALRIKDTNGSWYPVLFHGKKYFPECLVWLIKTGDWVEDIEFRNGIHTDLRWSNLFDARAQCEVTIRRCGDLFVLWNGEEQVVVDESVERVMDIARSILEPRFVQDYDRGDGNFRDAHL